MSIKDKIKNITPEMIEWRHAIHERPEVAYQEENTSVFIANKLRKFDIEVHQGSGKTGIVGVIHGTENEGQEKAIGIRADIDARQVTEQTK